MRPPATASVIAHPRPPVSPPTAAEGFLRPPRVLPGVSRDLGSWLGAAVVRGRCFQAGPDGNLPSLAGIAAYRLDGEEPPPLRTAGESGPPRDGEHPAALRGPLPVTSGCGTPSPRRSRLS